MLPSYVNLIFLSATTPNTLEFSEWVARTKKKPIHVVKTDYRPVPLSHYLWAGLDLHKIMEGKGGFIEKGYKDASMALMPQSVKDANKKGQKPTKPSTATGSKQLAWQAQGSKQNWMSLVRYLDREFLTPSVVFSFSQKKCEEIAQMLRSLDLNTAKERSAVKGFCLQATARLSQNDAKLPQVLLVCEMVERGIGIHHGGLLPLLKEVVEILFGKGLIKVLFATETFVSFHLLEWFSVYLFADRVSPRPWVSTCLLDPLYSIAFESMMELSFGYLSLVNTLRWREEPDVADSTKSAQ